MKRASSSLLSVLTLSLLAACSTTPTRPGTPPAGAPQSGTAPAQSAAPAASPVAPAQSPAANTAPQSRAAPAAGAVTTPLPAAQAPQASAIPAPVSTEERTQIEHFIDDMVASRGFDRGELEALFQNFTVNQNIIAMMTRPAEGMPWYKYKQLFITPARIAAGENFWHANQQILEQVSKQYQVPPQLILAILGIETFYGKNMGSYPVFNANATLFLGYPRRAAFFRKQLADFLRLCQQDGLDPRDTKGSYAGAMGMPQFISSSYRHYAVDFDGDGRRDLWNSVPDIAASVANYFRMNGWHPGEPVAVRASVTPDASVQPFLSNDLRPRYTLAQLAGAGITPGVDLDPASEAQLPVSLVRLDGAEGPEYYITFHNFYVITRYNRSPLYAMAAVEMMKHLH